MRITDCKVNHLTNPLGFDMPAVRVSYNVEDAAGRTQKDAEIRVALDPDMKQIIFDTGRRTDISLIGTDLPIDLTPRTRYYWTVTVTTDAGETAESDVNWFETAKMEEPWSAKWIACGKGDRHPVFSRDLDQASASLASGKRVAGARLYISGLGLYEAYLNGEKIGDEYLTPGCDHYDAWLQYQTYDITDELRKGHAFSVLLGDGWKLGRFGFYSGLVKENKAEEYSLIAEMHITYEDGTEETIGTDTDWSVKRSRITFSNIYDGEHVDDTLPETNEELVRETSYDGVLTARYSLPVRCHQTFHAKRIPSTAEGEVLVDFGQNMSGLFFLHVHEPAGTVIRLQFGEVLQDGHFYNENLRSAKEEYIYTSDGNEHTLRPHFTFYGFRYVKVSGISDFREEDLYVRALYSDVDDTGVMTTGHAKVNRLIENVRWGERSNFVDVPTDCPQRDERMGWTGDAQVFSQTAMFLSDTYAFYRKYLHDMATEQADRNGCVPDVVPAFGVNSFSGVWGDACCIIPWNLYKAYGDPHILEEQYDSMKSWVDFIRRIDGDNHNWRRQFDYADWVALDSRVLKKDTVIGGTDDAYISDLYYYDSANLVAQAAAVLGRTDDAKEYGALADKIRTYLQDDYFSKTGRCCCDTQTAQALALTFDIATNRAMTADMLKTALIRSGGKLQTGFTGTPFLCSSLCDCGMPAAAYDLLLNEECPGWLYEVNHGATTIWERWNSVEEDGSMSSTGMNSLNHYAYGAILNWMVRYVGGIRPLCPGYTRVRLEPVVDLRLGSASVSYRSIAGTYALSWKISGGRHIEVKFEVPFGCEAEVHLPQMTEEAKNALLKNDGIREEDGKLLATAGVYAVSYDTPHILTRVYTVDDEMRELQVRKDVVAVIDEMIPDFEHIDLAYGNRTLRDVVLNRTGDLYRDRQIDAANFRTEEQLEELNKRLEQMYS